MEARSLREDLLGIEGVEGADVDGDDASPSGLRIRIAEGADQHHVGREIRRVLSSHGLGTDTTLPGEGAVAVDAGSAHDDAMASMSDLAAEGSPEVATSDVATMTGSRRIIDLTEEEDEQVAPEFDAASTATLSPHASVVGIEKVGVEEGRSGIVISITT
ncbi:MAG: hypothetical protein KDB69_05435, partial [Acidimicrobiia bacterium]|nr:hypothetical protein [Acidimicrobiia bacterium]